jgi:dTDP-4-amino-4,6-dideoxy-D-galactose acyltransferase
MISKAEWDSKFFDYPIGILKIKEGNNFDLKKIIAESKEFKLVYIISEMNLEDISLLKLMDKKVIYSKQLTKRKNSEQILEYAPEIHSYDQLLNLAYLSGIYSRFKRDENFMNNEFHLLYKEWLDKSIDKKLSFKVLIKHLENEIAGFVTLNKKDAHTSEIGLIAVNEAFQGRNIGSKLIQECEFLSIKQNFSNIEVATQYENLPARRLYEKNNFGIKNITYIYHYWNL